MKLYYAETTKLPLNGFKKIRRWHARLNELEAWREPFPVAAAGRPTSTNVRVPHHTPSRGD